MEKLYELNESENWDLLVLDTPPTRDALDFLDAPRRLLTFIEGRSLRVFMKPTGIAARVAGRGATVALSILKRLMGFDLLEELSEFFTAFSGMVDGFRERAHRVSGLLADPATTFLVICGPQGEPISEAVYFLGKLEEADLPIGGIIVNKVHPPIADSALDGDLEGRLSSALGDEALAARTVANLGDYAALGRRDARNIAVLERELGDSPVIRVPYLDRDVHDIGGLAAMNEHLF